MRDTGHMLAGWRVMVSENGLLFLMNGAEVTSFPDARGTHPHNWHALHRWGPAWCPYCYAALNPGEIRSLREKYLEEYLEEPV